MGEIQGYNKEINISTNDIRKYIAPDLNEKELWLFMQTAKLFNLNPLKREIHAIKFKSEKGERFAVVVGYQVYLEKISSAGILEYWDVAVDKPEADINTWVGIFTAKRRDWTKEFVWRVPMREVNKRQSLWLVQPEFQLKKVAISQGCRMLCPELFSGFPYIAEELVDGHEFIEQGQEPIVISGKDAEQDLAVNDKLKIVTEKINKALESIKTAEDLELWLEKTKSSREKSEFKKEIDVMIEHKKREIEAKQELEEKISKVAEIIEVDKETLYCFVMNELEDKSLIENVLSNDKESVNKLVLEFNKYLDKQIIKGSLLDNA